MFSQQFRLPFDKNRRYVENIEARDSTMRPVDMEGERLQLVIDGIPMRTTVMKVGDDVVLEDSIDVNLDATNRTFKDMIADLKCRDVKVDDDILIGEKIGDVDVDINYALIADRTYKNKLKDGDLDAFTAEQIASMQALAAQRKAELAELYKMVEETSK
jgi:hypothetical protein